MSGKVALVTGASSGLGEHMARTLSKAGCNVALAARREASIAALAQRIEKEGGKALAVVMDVNDRDSVQSGFDQAVSHFAGIDVLVNNAGVADAQWFLEMSEEAWSHVIDTDLGAVWRVGQVAARIMVDQGRGGSIVNISSILGMAAQRTQTNYGAAKAGVIQLTRNMALELGRNAIRVNAIAPGYFVTEINRRWLTSKKGQAYLQKTVPQRAGEPAELDGALLLLASEAGSYISGSVITVDGGSMLGHL